MSNENPKCKKKSKCTPKRKTSTNSCNLPACNDGLDEEIARSHHATDSNNKNKKKPTKKCAKTPPLCDSEKKE